MSFIHLHNHSHYSVLDGAIKIDKMINKAASLNMNAIALTDHGNMCGAIEFYKTAKDKGIKPILGQEFYISPTKRTERNYSKSETSNYHLIILAMNNTGYKNLIKLSSIGYTEGFYKKPRIDFDILAQHSEGLICSSACIAGEVPSLVINNRQDSALQTAEKYKELFGERYFLEIQDHGLHEQKAANAGVIEIASKLNIPLIATNDMHYLDKEDAAVHELLLCVQTQTTMSNPSRMKFGANEFYFKTEEEMQYIFSDYPDAIHNTQVVADMCSVQLDLGHPFLPDFKVPENHTLDSYLDELVYEGAFKRFGNNQDDRIKNQIKYELSVIKKMGFSGYFLIVWDFIHHARKSGIPVGPGRGSAAGSIVSYCLEITQLNPLDYNLLFERFLNPDRNEMPDMDIDFCGKKRDEIIKYVKDKYGEDKVSQIMAFNTMKAKAAVKDVARAMDIPFDEANKITKMINPKLTIDKSLKESKELTEFYKSSAISKSLIDASIKLEGLVRSFGKHAAGIVISKEPITEYVPLYRDPKDGSICAQFEKNNCEKVGLVKMDFLGLNNLTIIDNALKLIKQNRDIDLDIDNLSLDDKKVYKRLRGADTNGIFQLESSGMQALLRKLGPTCFEDIIAVSALYRPGPLQSGMADQYCIRKKNMSLVSYDHECLEPVLKDTLGVIIYQEQVMKISQVMGGFSMAEADKLRKAMGKKIVEIVDSMKSKFLEGAKAKKIKPDIAEKVYDAMAKFAEYGFNKSHSAAYGLITFQTAYLKTHYTIEYMTALLSGSIDKQKNQDNLGRYIADCKSKNIAVLRPDINHSSFDFTIEGDAIRFGFRAIKGVGDKAIEVMLNAKKKAGGYFKTLKDFFENCDSTVNKGVIEALIKSGAFTDFCPNRAMLFYQIDHLLEAGKQLQADKKSGQVNLFDAMSGNAQKPMDIELKNMQDWNENIKLSFEKEVLGVYITGHPLAKYEKEIRAYSSCSIASIPIEFKEGKKSFSIVGIITNYKKKITQTGKDMVIANIEDMEGTIETLFFPKTYKTYAELIKPEELIMATGDIEIDGNEDDEEPKYKFFVKEVKSLKDARSQAIAALHLNIDSRLIGDTSLVNLKKIIESNKGGCPVYFHISLLSNGQDKVTVKANNIYCINPNETVINSMVKELGNESVRLTYKNQC